MKKLYIVATPIGNARDLSERARDVLTNVNAVLAEDTRVTAKLLFMLKIKKPTFSCHKFNETKVSETIGNLFEKFETIALVCDAGTPGISDPGAIIVAEARKIGVQIEVIPGASAVVSAMSLAGINKTEFAFLGFFPRTNKDQLELCKKLSENFVTTFVLYESPLRIVNTLKVISENVKNINKVCVFNDLTKQFERHYCGNIESVISEMESNPNVTMGEYVFVLDLKRAETKQKEQVSLEGLIVDYVVKNNSTIKDAIKNLSMLGFNKNELYKASLNLKNIMGQKN